MPTLHERSSEARQKIRQYIRASGYVRVGYTDDQGDGIYSEYWIRKMAIKPDVGLTLTWGPREEVDSFSIEATQGEPVMPEYVRAV